MAKKQWHVIRAWIGLLDGRLHYYASPHYSGVRHADLFRSRAAAKWCYEDVRRVTITVEPETREET